MSSLNTLKIPFQHPVRGKARGRRGQWRFLSRSRSPVPAHHPRCQPGCPAPALAARRGGCRDTAGSQRGLHCTVDSPSPGCSRWHSAFLPSGTPRSPQGSSSRAGPGRAQAGPAGSRGAAAAAARPCRSEAGQRRPLPPAAPRAAAVPGAAPRAPVPSPVPVLTSPPPPGRAGKGRPRLRPARGGHTVTRAGPAAGARRCSGCARRGN